MDDWDIGFRIRVFGKSASESELLGFLLPNKACWDVGIQTRVVVIFGFWLRFNGAILRIRVVGILASE